MVAASSFAQSSGEPLRNQPFGVEQVRRVVARHLALDLAHHQERHAHVLLGLLVVHDLGHRHVGVGAHELDRLLLELEVEGRERGVGRLGVRGEAGHERLVVEHEEHGVVGHAAVGDLDLREVRALAPVVAGPLLEGGFDLGPAPTPRHGALGHVIDRRVMSDRRVISHQEPPTGAEGVKTTGSDS